MCQPLDSMYLQSNKQHTLALRHGLDTEEGRQTGFPLLGYGCQLRAENQNKRSKRTLEGSSMAQLKMSLV
jgi:hypothetical protein